MSWKLVETTTSERVVECGACGVAMPAAEAKVRLNPVRKHDGKVFFYMHVGCFVEQLAGTIPELLRRGRW